MGDEKVKDRTLVGGEKRPNKSTTKTQMKLSSTAFKSSRPQTVVQKPSGDRSGLSSAVKLTKTNTTTTSKLSVPINRRNAPNDDPMRTSRSSITSPGPKIPVDRKRSKSQLTLIAPIKPTKVAQFNNHTSSVSLARQKLTSGSSVTNCHRPGTRPHYLNKPNQMSLESQLTEKQRKFALVKKQLIDNQENCKQHFNEMIELNGKLSKMGGKQAKLEKLQLMYLVPIGDGVEEQAADKVGDVEKKSSTCDQSSGTDVEKSVAGDPTLVNPPTVFQPNVNLDMDQSTFKLVEDQLRMAHTAPFKLCSESLVNCCNLSSLLSEVSFYSWWNMHCQLLFKIFIRSQQSMSFPWLCLNWRTRVLIKNNRSPKLRPNSKAESTYFWNSLKAIWTNAIQIKSQWISSRKNRV